MEKEYGLVGIVRKYILTLPTIFNRYWFFTAYILLYIFSPYLNILIHNIKQKDYQKLLLTEILIWSVIPTVFGILKNGTEGLLYFNRFIWAIVIYLIGAYMNLYPIKFLERNRKNSVLIAVASFAIMIFGIIVIYTFRDFFKKLGTTEVAYFWEPNALPMLFLSVSVFKIFVDLKMKGNKIINTLASTTLGIYLLHDGPLSVYIWKNVFHTKEHLNSNFLIVYIVASSIAIFLVGAAIDLARQLLEKQIMKIKIRKEN